MTGVAMPLILVLLAIALAVAMQRIGAQSDATWPQRAPFLGGGLPETHAWQRFHVRYYPMALLFIAFEMEMMFMYPWAVVYVETGLKALAEMGMFLGIPFISILFLNVISSASVARFGNPSQLCAVFRTSRGYRYAVDPIFTVG